MDPYQRERSRLFWTVAAAFFCAVGLFSTSAIGARVVGADGVVFRFPGRPESQFCMVSDGDFHINAHMIGRAFESKHITWIGGLAIIYKDLHLFVKTSTEALWDPFVDHLEVRINGEALHIPAPGYKTGPRAKQGVWDSPGNNLRITRQRVNEARIQIGGVVDLRLKADTVQQEWWTEDDCFVHLDMEFRDLRVSKDVHGFLGQTYRPARVQAARVRAEQNTENSGTVDDAVLGSLRKGPAIAGRMSDYLSSGLWSTDCKFSKFTYGGEKGELDVLQALGDERGLRGAVQKGVQRGKTIGAQFEDVNPLEAYFSENAVRVVRRTKVVSDSENDEVLEAFESEEDSSQSIEDVRVSEISKIVKGTAVDGSDVDEIFPEAPLGNLMDE